MNHIKLVERFSLWSPVIVIDGIADHGTHAQTSLSLFPPTRCRAQCSLYILWTMVFLLSRKISFRLTARERQYAVGMQHSIDEIMRLGASLTCTATSPP
jgi:hypothetical protein